MTSCSIQISFSYNILLYIKTTKNSCYQTRILGSKHAKDVFAPPRTPVKLRPMAGQKYVYYYYFFTIIIITSWIRLAAQRRGKREREKKGREKRESGEREGGREGGRGRQVGEGRGRGKEGEIETSALARHKLAVRGWAVKSLCNTLAPPLFKECQCR